MSATTTTSVSVTRRAERIVSTQARLGVVFDETLKADSRKGNGHEEHERQQQQYTLDTHS